MSMEGTVTISIKEYELLKGLVGKRVYDWEYSQEQIDYACERLNNPDIVVRKYYTSHFYPSIYVEAKDAAIKNAIEQSIASSMSLTETLEDQNKDLKEIISKLKARNILERIFRIGED